MIRLRCISRCPYPLPNPRLASLAYLWIPLFQSFPVFRILPLILWIFRVCQWRQVGCQRLGEEMLVLEACWAEESLVRRDKDRRGRAFYSLCISGAWGFIESRWIGDVAVLDNDLIGRLLTGARGSKVKHTLSKWFTASQVSHSNCRRPGVYFFVERRPQ